MMASCVEVAETAEAEGCDTTLAGVRALGSKLDRYEESAALCHYNCGNTCYEGGRQYARAILDRREELRHGLAEFYGWFSC